MKHILPEYLNTVERNWGTSWTFGSNQTVAFTEGVPCFKQSGTLFQHIIRIWPIGM